MSRWRQRSLVAASVCLALAGCKVGPDYEVPETTVPDVWEENAAKGVRSGEAPLQTWWKVLDDPLLEELIVRAEEENLDLEQAVGRIRESRALVRVSKSQLKPQVGAGGNAQRIQASEAGPIPTPPGGIDTIGLYNVGFDAVWELDVFGRIRRGAESATAAYQATIEDYRDVLVTLFADVAVNYIGVRAFQERLDYARGNVEIQQETLQLTQDRFNAGLVSALDVAQAESNLANSEAAIPTLETGLILSMNRLAVLLGEAPGELRDELGEPDEVPDPPDEITIGLPGDLLRQRPDVRRAERDLASQTARIGVAVADLYPRFSLTGFLGLQSVSGSDLFDGDAVTWTMGLPFSWKLFSGGQVRGNIEAEKARTEQALSFYEQTVLLALEEVENSLTAYDREQARRDKLLQAVDANERSVELVRTQYLAGLTNFQNVLDTQRSLFNKQDELAESEGVVVQNLIAIYKAVGGGWAEDGTRTETFTVGAAEETP